jgi:chromosome partitioning protein
MGTSHNLRRVRLTTPAGLEGKRLQDVVRIADKVVVPLQASMFDILVTQSFLQQLLAHHSKADIGVIGMRVTIRTHAADQLANYVSNLGLPVLAYLRDTQNYVQLAALGRRFGISRCRGRRRTLSSGRRCCTGSISKFS